MRLSKHLKAAELGKVVLESFGFASLSDSSDHKAESIHNALKPKMETWLQKEKKKFVICSDSPSSQYRNSKIFSS